ncbi:type III pantothenate kinase [Edaphobacillus lindanitolerans]|uniref:Type III pantothenate kinase n=1 Tax=Edaphobacillus lindanitolerans TaxID=550447 RepID=A0A1U7PU09_9BACI|nr:type III pantothenate kinase [Edaphobacillus lindanitolerans]SIT93331.1 type III pantothenate kinase [Edaphobacillus lindanitolerans]
MILVMDTGNTNIVLGVYDGDELKYQWRMGTNRHKTEDEFGMQVKALFEHAGVGMHEVEGIIISSVVPPIMFALEHMCEKYFGLKPLVVGPGVKTGLNIKYENPREVGADRIVNAVAGIQEYGSPLIIVDFGTATTLCYINERNEYMGGVIAPGIGISTEALFERASKLPRVELVRPEQIIGKNTVAAMQAGIVFGYVGQVEGLIARIKATALTEPKVIATGGLAPLIAAETDSIDVVDGQLTLKGLKLIYDRNQ